MNKRSPLHLFVRVAAVFALMALSALAPRTLAQAGSPELAALGVELWPDYDQPSMLVLLTGTLSPGMALPATVTIPLPPNADLHAVARPASDGSGSLIADVAYTTEDGQVTLTLTDPRFRVEYYAPLSVDGDQRSYDFSWLSELPVAQLSAAVQQPLSAEGFTVEPAPVNVDSLRGDGLLYHSLASRSVAAGEPFDILVAYASPTGALSGPALAAQAPPAANTAAVAPAAQTGGLFDNFNPLWLLGIFGVAALVGVAFYFGRQQAATASGRPRKPAPNRPAKSPVNRATPPPAAKSAAPAPPAASTARFCHQCGEPIVAGDRFCRNCGTAVKSGG